MTIVVSQVAAAVTWGPPVAISATGAAGAHLTSTTISSTQTVHVAYTESSAGLVAMYRRSADGGASWGAPKRISRAAAYGAIALAIDNDKRRLGVVIGEFDASNNFVIWYRQSTNNGTTWAAPIRLTPKVGDAGMADVALSGARVSVVWTDGANGRIYARVSTDGGLTFAPKVQVGSTTNQPYAGSSSYDGFAVVADAAGTLNVAWKSDDHTVQVRPSADGTVWPVPRMLATNADGRQTTIAAFGARVVVGYTSAVSGHWRATWRRSSDAGGAWKAARLVGGRDSFRPVFAFRNGVLRAAFSRCTVSDCSVEAAFLRTSANFGTVWSTPVRVNAKAQTPGAVPVGVGGLASGASVVTYAYYYDGGGSFLYARKTQ